MAEDADRADNSDIRQQLQQCFSALQRIAGNLSVRVPESTSARSASVLTTSLAGTTFSGSSGDPVRVSQSQLSPLPAVLTSAANHNPSPLSVFQEHRNVFRNPTRHTRVPLSTPYTRQSRPSMWNHNFLCLASRFCVHVPNREEKERLMAAGLGEKRVRIGMHASSVQLHEKLLMVFPKLQHAGGYDLLRCLSNSRSLVRLQPTSEGFSPNYLKNEVGQARLYLRPLQREIPLAVSLPGPSNTNNESNTNSEGGPSEQCLTCSSFFPFDILRQHVSSCSERQVSNSSPSVSVSVSLGECISSSSLTITSPTINVLSPTQRPPTSVTTTFSSSMSSCPTTSLDCTVVSDDSDCSIQSPPMPVSSKLAMVGDLFPQLTAEQICLLCKLYHNDSHQLINAVLQGVTVESLLCRFRQNKLISPTKLITVRPDRIVEDGLRCLYKGEIILSAPIEVEIQGVPAVDLGGLRRQFFTDFLRDMPIKLKLVEQNGPLYFFTCNTDCMLSGHYARLAQVIVHSVLQEGPAFPHLPKAVYYYLVGGVDMAIEHLCIDELPLSAQHVVQQILAAEDEETLQQIQSSEYYFTVSNDIVQPLKMATKDLIVQQIMLNQVIFCRKASIDQFMDGLSKLMFRELFQQFPALCEPLFVYSSTCSQPTPLKLLDMLKVNSGATVEQQQTFSFVKEYVSGLSAEGCEQFLRFCTGSSAIPPSGFRRQNITIAFASANAIQTSTCFQTITIPTFEDLGTLRHSFDAVITEKDFNDL